MVTHRAAKQGDKVIERNGKIYIFFNRKHGFDTKGNLDEKPQIYNDWEDAGSAYNIFG